MENKEKSRNYKQKIHIVRYVIGSLIIFGNIMFIPNFYAYFGIFVGLSFYPAIYNKILKHIRLGTDYKTLVLMIVPLLLLIAWGCVLPTSKETLKEEENHGYIIFEFYNDEDKVEQQRIKEDELLEKPNPPTKEGYIFSHWSTNKYYCNEKDGFDFNISPTKSDILYAHFEEESASEEEQNKEEQNENDKKTQNNGNNNITTKPNTENTENSSTTANQRQALKKAKSYLDSMTFSREGLISQLKYEGFTQTQAEYGVSQNGL